MVKDSRLADVTGRDGTVADGSWNVRVAFIYGDSIKGMYRRVG